MTKAWISRLGLCLALGLFLSSLTGCQIIIGMLMILRGPPTITADFTATTGKSLGEKGKKVIVLCTSPEKARGDDTALDLDIIAEVSRRFDAHGIKVIDPNLVANWLDDNGQFTEDDLPEIAEKLKADYVVCIEVEKFQYKDRLRPGLFQGDAQGKISVVMMRQAKGESSKRTSRAVYNKRFSSQYPLNQPVSQEQVSGPAFRKQFIDRVAEELARLFYDHRPGDEM